MKYGNLSCLTENISAGTRGSLLFLRMGYECFSISVGDSYGTYPAVGAAMLMPRSKL
jgi:hypothetical protein